MVGPLYVAVRGGWEKQFGSSGSVLASQGPRPVETASLPGSVSVSQVMLRNVELGQANLKVAQARLAQTNNGQPSSGG